MVTRTESPDKKIPPRPIRTSKELPSPVWAKEVDAAEVIAGRIGLTELACIKLSGDDEETGL